MLRISWLLEILAAWKGSSEQRKQNLKRNKVNKQTSISQPIAQQEYLLAYCDNELQINIQFQVHVGLLV